MALYTDDRTLGEMFAELSRETKAHLQQEARIAKAELSEKASKAGRSTAFLVTGGLVAYGGFLALVAALVLALMALGLLAWASALIGGFVVAGVGYLLVRAGLAGLKAEHLTPHQTIANVTEDARWIKMHAVSTGTAIPASGPRARMTQTMSAIKQRLRPSHIVSQAKETVRDATIGRVVDIADRARTEVTAQAAATRATVAYTARTSPVSVGLVGTAAAWLIVRALRRPRVH